jgi:L-asparaginase
VETDQNLKKVVVLGTGGTIAGKASSASDNIGYTAAQVGVAQLLGGLAGLQAVLEGRVLVSEQVAQVDSKDMDFAVWLTLAKRIRECLDDDTVQGVVVTHGTDTLEETAYFLHVVLPVARLMTKPVVLTCAMRPSSSFSPDGPQNLLDAVAVVLTPGAHGVVAVCAGTVHSALDVKKDHTYKLDAFSSGDAGPLAYVEEGRVRLLRNWPLALLNSAHITIDDIALTTAWPRVEVVMNHVGGSAAVVDALLLPLPGFAPLRGLVVAATGNGTMHVALEGALRRAQAQGVRVVRSTRCASGRVLKTPGAEFSDALGLSPVKARIALMLAML